MDNNLNRKEHRIIVKVTQYYMAFGDSAEQAVGLAVHFARKGDPTSRINYIGRESEPRIISHSIQKHVTD